MRDRKINNVLQQFCIYVGFLQILLAAENPPIVEDTFLKNNTYYNFFYYLYLKYVLSLVYVWPGNKVFLNFLYEYFAGWKHQI